jgi:hypothetical protein
LECASHKPELSCWEWLPDTVSSGWELTQIKWRVSKASLWA